jgi:DNA-binding MarR family transcriptional regulator
MVTTGAMTKRIDRLERAGLVTRRRSSEDGRARVVALTPEGLALIDRAFSAHMTNESRLLAHLSEQEAQTLERILAAWIERLEDADPHSRG